ncbi:MAG: hypothetical protein WC378_17550 [Opitutaceae bacterium]|jgi:hypothetical protein
MSECVIFKNRELLPREWRALEGGPLWCFNPSLLCAEDGWWLAYRLVGEDQRRRIGSCRLNEKLEIVAESASPLSDTLRVPTKAEYPEQARNWFADPRLLRLGTHVFLYWNSGWHEPRNHQFLQELDLKTMTPMGDARELVLKGERRTIEKNWMLFGQADGVFAVYSVSPHRILRLDMNGAGDIALEDAYCTDWSAGNSAEEHGELRGGAAPVLTDGLYTSFCHSVHDSPVGYRYVPSAYQFDAKPPFAAVSRPLHPLGLGNPFGAQNILPRLNPPVGEVVYPCGAAIRRKSDPFGKLRMPCGQKQPIRQAQGALRAEATHSTSSGCPAGRGQRPEGPVRPASTFAEASQDRQECNNAEWLISYGINDERCAVAVLPHAEVMGAMEASR